MHDRLLMRLGLTPQSIAVRVSKGAVLDWIVGRIPLLLALPLGVLGLALFWIPREVTGRLGERLARAEGEDTVPTYRVLGGVVIFVTWFLLLAVAAGVAFGALAGVLTFFALPGLAFAALAVGESRRASWDAIRRFVVLRTQRERIVQLRTRQRAIAERLRELLAGVTHTDARPSVTEPRSGLNRRGDR